MNMQLKRFLKHRTEWCITIIATLSVLCFPGFSGVFRHQPEHRKTYVVSTTISYLYYTLYVVMSGYHWL